MKQRITEYTFNASAKTVDFSSISGFDGSGVLAIINRDIVLYAVGATGLKFANVAGSVITLNAGVSTSGMADNDPLLIFYDDAINPSPGPGRIGEKVTKSDSTDIATGAPRGFLVGTSGTANLLDVDNVTFTNVPLQAGYNPIRGIKRVKTGGTADDIWTLL